MSKNDPQSDELVEAGAPPPGGAPPPSEEIMEVPDEGLENRGRPKKVLIIGAGIAGLVAAYELKNSGHETLILEAQNRIGGRIYTLRNFAPGLYAEAGAMRIPRAHTLTLEYCERFDLELRPFMMGNPKGIVFLGGQRMTMEEAAADPSRLPYQLDDSEQGRDVNQMWEEAIADLKQMVDEDWDAGWEYIVKEFDRYSLRQFLRLKGFSEDAIELFGVMNFVEADMGSAVVEQLREDIGRAYVDMQEVVGGMDRLPMAFYEHLKDNVRFGTNVHAVDQTPDSVTVHFKTEAGRFSETADFVIITIPFSVLRTVEFVKPLSNRKQKAIRQLHYAASTKILFQVRDRFWEKEGIYGGATVTDLAIRRMNYPTPDPSNPRGVLLASYTWSQDAARWGAMDPETRQEEALDDVARIHPLVRDAYEGGSSHAWYNDPYAAGAFALFEPEQQTTLHNAIVEPEGRMYFAGEHCSLYHAWIQGSLESGIRAAKEINELPAR